MPALAEADWAFEVAVADITSLGLTQEEGVVVSRMLGRRVTLPELVREGIVAAARAPAVVEALVKKGALLVVSGGKRHASGGKDPYAGLVFSARDLAEPADLTEDQKKRVLFVEMHLDKWSHYKLLGLRRTCPQAEIKAGYFRASKEFHPDAYFRKNLGIYKDKIDKIFRAQKAAYDLLADADKRARYDETAIIELTPEEEEELEKIAEAKRKEIEAADRDKRNAERMKASRLKHNPMVDRIKKARDYMKLAEDAQSGGRLEEAANHARLALSFDEGLRPRAEQIILEADRTRAKELMKRVQQLLMSDVRDVADELNRIVDQAADIGVASKDGVLCADVSAILLRLKRPQRAAKIAQTATELLPREKKSWEALAEAAHADAKWAILARASERWLALDEKNPRAKELWKLAKRNL